MTATTTACDTCTHHLLGHGREGCFSPSCPCRLYIDPTSVRAELRAVARGEGWGWREQEFLDDFHRDGEFVTVVYTDFDRVLGANTVLAYVAGPNAGRQAALDALAGLA